MKEEKKTIQSQKRSPRTKLILSTVDKLAHTQHFLSPTYYYDSIYHRSYRHLNDSHKVMLVLKKITINTVAWEPNILLNCKRHNEKLKQKTWQMTISNGRKKKEKNQTWNFTFLSVHVLFRNVRPCKNEQHDLFNLGIFFFKKTKKMMPAINFFFQLLIHR